MCKVIKQICEDAKDRRYLQKIAGDVQAIEKLIDILLDVKVFNADIDANGKKNPIFKQNIVILKTLAALSS